MLLKFKILLYENPCEEDKRTTERKKIFPNHISDERLVSRLYKKKKKNNSHTQVLKYNQLENKKIYKEIF